MAAARRKEIKGLLERGTFEIIFKREVPSGAHLLPARFVFAIMSTLDGEIKFKARYVICGNRDRLKDMIVHSTQTIQASSTRLLLSLASTLARCMDRRCNSGLPTIGKALAAGHIGPKSCR